MAPKYFDVAVDIPAVADRRFTYSAPDLLSLPMGAKVEVPFGRGFADAYVLGEVEAPPAGVSTKALKAVYDLEFMPGDDLMRLALWASDYYCVALAPILSAVWPSVAKKRKPEDAAALKGGPPLDAASVRDAAVPGCLRRSYLIRGSPAFRWTHYLRLLREVRARGLSALVLVPEIKMIPSAWERLNGDFPGEVALLHSDLTGVARREGYLGLRRGDKKIGLGTRSAAFAEVPDLGLIVVDEESSDSYKSPDMPFYDARTVARTRADMGGCGFAAGSAHPTVSAVYWASKGPATVIAEGKEVHAEGGDPERLVVDLGQTRRGQVISEPLSERLSDVFGRGGKALILINRRGDSSQIVCRDCGRSMSCPRCGIPLAFHSDRRSLVCHVCGYTSAAPETCPFCGGHDWRFLGIGIERALSEFKKLFPGVASYRLDKDVASGKAAGEVLAGFARVGPSCLLATKMVLGLPGVSGLALAAVLSCDSLLSLPDYRASEKVFHLLSSLEEMLDPEASYRGLVVQTRNPGHPAVRGILDPDSFYATEMDERSALGYPPFGAFLVVRFSARNGEKVKEAAERFAGEARSNGVEALGPAPCYHARVRGEYRWQVALKSKDWTVLSAACRLALAAVPKVGVRATVDVDPVDVA